MTHKDVPHTACANNWKCKFVCNKPHWKGNILCVTEWPTYIMVAFIPAKINGLPDHHFKMSITMYNAVSSM